MSQGEEGNVDVIRGQRTVNLQHTHREEGTKQPVLTFVPPPLAQTCGPEAEKTAGHRLSWSERNAGEERGVKRFNYYNWRQCWY